MNGLTGDRTARAMPDDLAVALGHEHAGGLLTLGVGQRLEHPLDRRGRRVLRHAADAES